MIKEISGSFRTSFKQPTIERGDIFYTFEYGETRTVDENVEEERKEMWESLTNEVSKKIQEILDMYKKKS